MEKEKEKPSFSSSLMNSVPLILDNSNPNSSLINKNPSVAATRKSYDTLGRQIITANGVSYAAERIIGSGSFGVVFQASLVGSNNEVVAIKKVLQDKRFKNRELQIMSLLTHPNIVKFKNSFYSNGERADDVFLNLVLEYVPETIHKISRHYSRLRQSIPIIYIKLYMYQLSRALCYIHSLGICHRDVKPQNLLLDTTTSVLKLCDFGSAKVLTPTEPSVSYICSRYYRAPELIFGSTSYDTSIDVWSMGCVMAELMLGQPLFPGESSVDQLVEIIKVLGTPTREQILAMNNNYTDFRFPQIKGHPWPKVFHRRTPPEALDFVDSLLQYTPNTRTRAVDALVHPFFDELREVNVSLPNQRSTPLLFDFTTPELSAARHIPKTKLIPSHGLGQCSVLDSWEKEIESSSALTSSTRTEDDSKKEKVSDGTQQTNVVSEDHVPQNDSGHVPDRIHENNPSLVQSRAEDV
eukprot:TRINITY_DN7525_c0_g1_i1.p1 TRINITY_DN7525_c0_g1~~TRINITY_DN7525_c0_g1_i1.p1  ORF type:complete len:528 (+),score=83.04 TRINITY_DN7525_c0_g1_i1:189-1586(+)